MKVLKYLRLGNARFVSHIDVLRQAARILRRAEIPVKYSKGFNPHALVFFSPPCSVGVGSLAEYVAIDTDMPAEEVMERYNAAVGADMRAVKSFDVAGNVTLRADRVFDAFRREGLCTGALPDTLKLAQYVRAENGVLRDVDDCLSSFPTV